MTTETAKHRHTTDPRRAGYDPDHDPMLGCVDCLPEQCSHYAGDPGASAPRCELARGHAGRHAIRVLR